MAECTPYTTIPELPSDFCNGRRYSTKCVFSEDAFTLLELESDTSLDLILNALVVSINNLKTRLDAQDIIIEDLENRVAILEP